MASTAPTPIPTADVEKDAIVQDTVVPKGKVAEKLLKHSHDADAAMKAFEGMEGQVIELSEEKSKALLRKIDWHLMPVSSLLSTFPHTHTHNFNNTLRIDNVLSLRS